MNATRARALILLPLLALDCLLNWILFTNSWRYTMSGEAWNQRDTPGWRWCWRAINFVFFWQPNHCQIQAAREAHYGGVWPAWADAWKAAGQKAVA